MNHILLKTILVVIGLVVGGAVTFGIMKLTQGSSGDDDGTSTANGTRVTDTLQYIAVMSRHGNRGSSVDYPDDPYPIDDVTYWPYGANQLTNYGRHQEYNLGKRLRALYNGFLNTTYSSKNIKSTSDTVERVIYSGELMLQGLFPPEGFQKWDDKITWQPVVLWTNSSDHTEDLDSCDRFQTEQTAVYDHFQEENAANISSLAEYFYSYSNETLDADDLVYTFEKIYSELEEGFSLPSVLDGVFPHPLTEFYLMSTLVTVAGTDNMVRLRIGDLYGEILDMMNTKINGSSPDLKMNYYSAHDCSIISLQIALGLARDSIINWVRVGSALVIELHKEPDTGNYYVEVIYIDGFNLDAEPFDLSKNMTDCGEPCYYGALVNSTMRFFDKVNYTEECLAPSNSSTSDFEELPPTPPTLN